MKNSGKLLFVLLLVLSALITSLPCSAQAPAQAAEARAAEAQAAQEKWVAVVTSAQGGVYVQRAGQTRWEPLNVGDKCNPGDSIRVEENSRAALLFKNDSTLRIDQNSHLSFQPMEEQTVIMRLFNGAACFFSRFPRSLKIFTPHMNGTVKGTEFVIRVDGDQTQLTLYEGQVLAENEKGELLLAGGQSVVAKKDQAPALVTVVRPRDAVQWALYYPAIQDFSSEDFQGEADWQGRTRTSVEAWRRGDLAGATSILKGLRDEGVTDTRYLLYRASLALTVGRVDEASAYLERTLRADPKNANAVALQSIIATTQSNKAAALDLATRAVSLDPQSSAARI
ncbi:MAG: tetratricopeptide repeat protein, partial [Candidatus Aminicenantes bacterium]|nr:tetratricopeptide repeat protein [Candidatus Aminicenantes bacterium]